MKKTVDDPSQEEYQRMWGHRAVLDQVRGPSVGHECWPRCRRGERMSQCQFCHMEDLRAIALDAHCSRLRRATTTPSTSG